jgi:predicted phosphoribosyltransferase
MIFNATFNNISVISWQSVLLVKKIGLPVKSWQSVLLVEETGVEKTTDLSQVTDPRLSWIRQKVGNNLLPEEQD